MKKIIFLFLAASVAMATLSCKKDEPAANNNNNNAGDTKDYSEITYKSYDQAMADSRKDGKPVYLFYHAPWCGVCNNMKATTFKDKQFINLVMRNYHPAMVNQDDTVARYNFEKYTNLPITYLNGTLQSKLAPADKEFMKGGLPLQFFIKPDGTDNHKVRARSGRIAMADHLKIMEANKSW